MRNPVKKAEQVIEMVNTMPIELICVLAHQKKQHGGFSDDQLLKLLKLFPPSKRFSFLKRAIRQNKVLARVFKRAVERRLDRARDFKNYVTRANNLRIEDEDGLAWTYNADKSIFPPSDKSDVGDILKLTYTYLGEVNW